MHLSFYFKKFKGPFLEIIFILIFFAFSFGFMGMLSDFQRFLSREKAKVNHAITTIQISRERKERDFFCPVFSLSHISLSFSFFFFYFFSLSFTFLFSFSFSCLSSLFVFWLSFPPNSSKILIYVVFPHLCFMIDQWPKHPYISQPHLRA